MTASCRPLYFAALVLLLTGVAACQSEGPEQGATVSQLIDDPQQYIGQNVTVSGEIEQVFSDAAFAIGGEEFGDRLMVYMSPSVTVYGQRSAPDTSFMAGDIVQLTGQVRRYVSISAERGGEQNVDIPYDDQAPALLASRVYLTPRIGRSARPADTAAAVTADTTVSDTARATDTTSQP